MGSVLSSLLSGVDGSVVVITVLLAVLAPLLLRSNKGGKKEETKKIDANQTQDEAKEGAKDYRRTAAKERTQQVRRESKVFKLDSNGEGLDEVYILHGGMSGNCADFAEELGKNIHATGKVSPTTVLSLEQFYEDGMTMKSLARKNAVCILIVATYTGGTPPPTAQAFFDYLEDSTHTKTELAGLRFAVVGLGHKDYATNYNVFGRYVDKRMAMLGAKRVYTRGEDDEAQLGEGFRVWQKAFLSMLERAGFKKVAGAKSANAGSNGGSGRVKIGELQTEEEKKVVIEDPEESDDESAEESDDDLDDLEDLGLEGEDGSGEAKEMVTESLRKNLTKQGYKIIGSHSGVKLCRWTKAMLRGRGGCYKHTFYGISSFQCMEMTPSLACANKCVFCWRHHKNPVGREWRWKADDPKMLIDGAIEQHRGMMKQMKGVPGVKKDRYEESMNVKHCALSLVGEPIIYPHINEFVGYLHEKNISSFLVTNAQFPELITALPPVTQLYVSIDASNEEDLKRIDRPLFTDFWQRFLDSIEALGKTGQRTVFRLTLVKGWNMDELDGYAALVKHGNPCMIEVKGVTYCGGKKPVIGMKEVPWHDEVIRFCSELAKLLGDEYEIASEHAHSCCVLLARKDFKINGEWYTWIDFDKFAQLEREGKPFDTSDYLAKTPYWAVYRGLGVDGDGGFDPAEVHMKRDGSIVESGC
uniref:tRNA 4-demethylwyosine synthase (AdoMet-dependent) n=1 Tax=Palpitomonas bilix TaxID=652834 RepID=A0A7S3DFP5_9EUKA